MSWSTPRLPRTTTSTSATSSARSPATGFHISAMSAKPPRSAPKRKAHESPAPVLGESDIIGEGDSSLITNLLPLDDFPDLFERLKSEIQWETMYHRGGEVPRLVAVEADIGVDGSFPLYRHPSDESPKVRPFSPTVAKIREHAQRAVGHELNHVLIQLYRDGTDHISEHSDKTLDIVRGSKIVNVSFGAQRTMTLRAKKSSAEWEAHLHNKLEKTTSTGTSAPSTPDIVSSDDATSPSPSQPSSADAATYPDPETSSSSSTVSAPPARAAQKIHLPHNSMFVLGQRTNAAWLHSIRPDKRPSNIKSPAEIAFEGQRISFTFRHIGTYLVPSDGSYLIYGQGATSKNRETAKPVISGDSEEREKMICAFGTENHLSDLDWDRFYGDGFDAFQ